VLVEATADVEREVSTYAGDDGTHDCWCGVVSSVAGVWMWWLWRESSAGVEAGFGVQGLLVVE
jgi:hypothetical protein